MAIWAIPRYWGHAPAPQEPPTHPHEMVETGDLPMVCGLLRGGCCFDIRHALQSSIFLARGCYYDWTHDLIKTVYILLAPRDGLGENRKYQIVMDIKVA